MTGPVRMRHPSMPEREIEVDALAVPHHRAAGWLVVDDQPVEARTSSRPAGPKRRRQAEAGESD